LSELGLSFFEPRELDDGCFESLSDDWFVTPLDDDSLDSGGLEDEELSFASPFVSDFASLEEVSESLPGVGRLSLR